MGMLSFVVLCHFVWPLGSLAQNGALPAMPALSEESLLFQEIPSVFGASKYEQKLSEAPASVTIVTASEIKMYGYRTLSDILQSVRGFYTTYDRNYTYLGVRGFSAPGDYNARVLLLLDGHRINDEVYNAAPMGTEFPVDVDLIDRVEIIRGPSSSIYGANAFFAVINVITKRGRDLKGTEVSGEAGSYDTYKGRATYGNRFGNGLESLFSASYYDSGGQDLYFRKFDRPSTNNGVARNADGGEYYSFFTKHTFHDLTLEGVYQSREKGIPTASFGTIFNDPRTKATDEYALVDLKYEHVFDNQLELMARAYFDRYYYHGVYAYERTENDGFRGALIDKDYAKGDGAGTEVQITKTLFEKHKVLAGGEYRNSLRQDQAVYDVNPVFVYLDDERESSNWAVYLQDEYRILQSLILNAGVRYDWYETFGASINPRVGLIFLPHEKTVVKLLYGEAFRPPNAFELYYNDGFSIKPAIDLDPETIRTYELVWEQYINKLLRLSASGFYYKVDNLISLQSDPSDGVQVFENLEGVESKGVELELDGKWASGIEGRISYTFQNAEDTETGERLVNSPEHMAKLNVIFPLVKDKLFAGTELRYLSARETLKENEADGAFVANLTLFARDLYKGLDVSAGVYNLFDADYGNPGSPEHVQDIITQDGISFRIKVTYSF
jgi:iron complex outermembrane receptor protein